MPVAETVRNRKTQFDTWLEVDRRRGRFAIFHLYCGIIASAVLFILGVTGAILTFAPEINRALNSHELTVTPQSTPKLPLATLVTAVQSKYPDRTLRGLTLPETATDPVIINLRGTRRGFGILINPWTAEILGDTTHLNHFTDYVRRLHNSLMIPLLGDVFVYLCGVMLLILGITGLRLWWRRRRFFIRPSTPRTAFRIDLHSALGIYLAVFVFSFAISAIRPIPMLFFVREPRSNTKTDKPPMPPDPLLARAAAQLPEASLVYIDYPPPGLASSVRIGLRFPEDHSENGRSTIFLDPADGHVVSVVSTREMSPLARYSVLWNWEIHTGTLFGMTSRVITAIACVLISALSLTGVLVWTAKTARKSPAA